MNNYTPIDHLIKEAYQPNQTPHTQKTQPVSFHPKGIETVPEHGLTPSSEHSEHMEIQEHVEHKIKDPEVQKHVQEKPQNVQVPKDLTKMGVKPVTKTGKFSHLQNVKIPIADEKVLAGKNAPITSSIRWLSELATYILRKAHIQLKQMGGQVVRVIQR